MQCRSRICGGNGNAGVQTLVVQLPAPYELDPHEWSVTLAAVLDCRNALLSLVSKTTAWRIAFTSTYQQYPHVVAAFNRAMDPVDALFLLVCTELHEIIPLKVDEAVSYTSHALEAVMVSSIWREEWSATSAFKKGQKVSSGVLGLVLTCRSMIFSFIQTLRQHVSVLQRLCASVITAAIRSVPVTHAHPLTVNN